MKAVDRVKQYIEHKGLTNSSFEKKVGLSNGYIGTQLRRNADLGEGVLMRILDNCLDLNSEWLLTGKGQMIINKNEVNEPKAAYGSKITSIPLIPTEAFAGIGGGDVSIRDSDIKEKYIVPEFNHADFMIKVKGSSMYPKYSSGDVVACKLIKSSTFLQWGKAHVIHTLEQGSLVKRLFPTDDGTGIECRSDNQDYPPFIVERDEITTIALIMGVIRLE